jgi:hypothetical protein
LLLLSLGSFILSISKEQFFITDVDSLGVEKETSITDTRCSPLLSIRPPLHLCLAYKSVSFHVSISTARLTFLPDPYCPRLDRLPLEARQSTSDSWDQTRPNAFEDMDTIHQLASCLDILRSTHASIGDFKVQIAAGCWPAGLPAMMGMTGGGFVQVWLLRLLRLTQSRLDRI